MSKHSLLVGFNICDSSTNQHVTVFRYTPVSASVLVTLLQNKRKDGTFRKMWDQSCDLAAKVHIDPWVPHKPQWLNNNNVLVFI